MPRLALLVALATILVVATTMGDVPGRAGLTRPTIEGLAYGADPAQVMDVFIPPRDVASPSGDRASRPAVVLVHGGGWTSGSRAAQHPVAAGLAARGWVVITPDYRLAPAHPRPAADDDVRAVVDHVRAHAHDLGIAPDLVVLAGASAGGHLAATVALDDEAPPIAGLVAWSGLYELDHLPDRIDGTPHEWLLYHLWSYLGCASLDDPDCLASARDASPVGAASADDPPTLLLHSRNELVPLEDARALHRALRRQRVPAQLEVHDGSTHGRSLVQLTDETVADFLQGIVT